MLRLYDEKTQKEVEGKEVLEYFREEREAEPFYAAPERAREEGRSGLVYVVFEDGFKAAYYDDLFGLIVKME